MPAVKSISYVSGTLSASSTTVDLTASNATDESQCTPHVSWISTMTDADGFLSSLDLQVINDAGTIKLRCTAGNAPTADMTIQGFVIEWDAAEVTVQTGTFDYAGESGDTATITSVTQANAFAVHAWLVATNPTDTDNWNAYCSRVRFTANDTLTFDRTVGGAGFGNLTGHWWVVEATGGTPVFTVQASDIAMTGTTATATLGTSVTVASTFVAGSYKSPAGNSDSDISSVAARLVDADTVEIARGFSSGTITATVFAVEMADSSAVQRGITAVETSGNVDQDITAVTQANSVVMAGAMSNPWGVTCSPVVDDFGSLHDRLRVVAQFLDSDTIRFNKADDSTESCDAYWQVVDFDIGSAANVPPFRKPNPSAMAALVR